MNTEQPSITMTFLLIEQFSAMCLMAAVESLRSANYITGEKRFVWRMVSHDGESVKASNGMKMEVDGKLNADFPTDYFFVVASLELDPPYRSKMTPQMVKMARGGVKIGALSLGTWILAKAGLLNDARCTIHWEGLPAFRETFPDIDIVNDLYVIDQNRYTASGGLSSMELMLDIISHVYTPELALKIANNFQLDRIRNSTSHQRSGSISRMDTMPPGIQTAVELMLANLEVPLGNAQIAKQINTSVRNLERTFQRKLGVSPARYYLSRRLEKARELLLHTNMSTLDIALQCGFSSSSYFARCFLREFKIRPSDLRKQS